MLSSKTVTQVKVRAPSRLVTFTLWLATWVDNHYRSFTDPQKSRQDSESENQTLPNLGIIAFRVCFKMSFISLGFFVLCMYVICNVL